MKNPKNYYPRGKISKDDEGAAIIQIYTKDKKVIMDFGKNIKWIGMDKDAALDMANALINNCEAISHD